jgi:hypothetical protein
MSHCSTSDVGKKNPMNRNTSQAWNTKYGPRRVRHDPPTLAEAIAAAGDLTDQLDAQIDIAASLMGISREQAMAEWPRERARVPQPKVTSSITFTTGRTGAPRAVVVERKPSRRASAPRKLGAAG